MLWRNRWLFGIQRPWNRGFLMVLKYDSQSSEAERLSIATSSQVEQEKPDSMFNVPVAVGGD